MAGIGPGAVAEAPICPPCGKRMTYYEHNPEGNAEASPAWACCGTERDRHPWVWHWAIPQECPKCGAVLQHSEDRQEWFCPNTTHERFVVTEEHRLRGTVEQEAVIARNRQPIEGVGPDAPTRVNEFGAGQSDVPYRFDLIDAPALFEMARVLDHGARKYGEGNWKGITVAEHLNHLIMHAYAYLAGDEQDDHLSHVLCRATFALGVKLQGGPVQQ